MRDVWRVSEEEVVRAERCDDMTAAMTTTVLERQRLGFYSDDGEGGGDGDGGDVPQQHGWPEGGLSVMEKSGRERESAGELNVILFIADAAAAQCSPSQQQQQQ